MAQRTIQFYEYAGKGVLGSVVAFLQTEIATMNRRRLIPIVAVLLVAILYWFFRQTAPDPATLTTQLVATPMPKANIPPSGAAPQAKPDPRSKVERMSEELEMTSRQPIAFYGKVVDQIGNPVAGVEVGASVQAVRVFMEENWKKHSTITGGDGRFQFVGLHGQDMGIFLEKAGYEFKSDHKRYAYSNLTPEGERHRPDATAPVVFKMWKRQGAEPLISGDKFFGVKGNGTPFTIDLARGAKSEGRSVNGDLIVSIVQPDRIADGQKFDWSFNIEAIGGGLIEAIDTQYVNEAPSEGYELQISQEFKATDRDWSEVVLKTFYVKSRNGNQFARVIAELHANYQGAAVFSVRYLVNPKAGSRNLEYDPLKKAPFFSSFPK